MSASVLERIDQQMEGLSPESVRFQVLVSLRKFRSSWVELGRLLTDIAYGGDYKDWGYEDFEIYCARELGLKKPTVKKLMVSYNYMKSYEPERLEKPEDADGYDVPEYQTVDLLKKVREREDINEAEKEELHRMAFECTTDEGVLRKEIKARLPQDRSPAYDRRELKRLVILARNFRQKLAACEDVPEGMKDRIDQSLLEMEALD